MIPPPLAVGGQSQTTALLVAIVGLAFATIAAVVALVIARPTVDNTAVIASIVGISAPIILALLGYMLQSVHKIVNSRMDEFKLALQDTATQMVQSARAEGVLAGKEEGASKANERTDMLAAKPAAPAMSAVQGAVPVTIVDATKPVPVKLQK